VTMFGKRTPAVLLDQQAGLLSAQLDGLNDGRVDAVHDARITTRRIRELLALVPPTNAGDADDDVASGYQQLGRALGKVRDIDVRIALLRNLETHAPQAAPSLVVVRLDHERERLAKMRRLIKTLEKIDVVRLIEALSARHPTAPRTRLTSGAWQEPLRDLLVERARRAVERIAHATGVYFPHRAHSARIAIKTLRYATEIAQAIGSADLSAPIKSLRKGQEVLGDLHDRQVLAETLSVEETREGIDGRHLRLIGQVLEGEILALHAKYLERRAAVREACTEIERSASPRVLTRLPDRAVMVGGALLVTGLAYGGRRLRAG
jgi:CHAD domain-containing protein